MTRPASRETLSERAVAAASAVHRNLSTPVLFEHAIRRGEGSLLHGGSFAVRSGARTGRSPRDKFVVRTPETAEHVWWGPHNQPLAQDAYEHVRARLLDYLAGKELYIQDCYVSQDPSYRRSVRVVTERAYHAVFARTMFIPVDPDGPEAGGDPELTILHAPFLELSGEQDGVNSDTAIVLHLDDGVILIAGSAYAGEMKKSVFTAMNYYLPLAGVLSLHSAANADLESGKTALFFGLSGTGKTTLSTDPERALIGDDEHAWTESGIFNIEGGCYAKVIRLSEEAEPEIFTSTRRFGTILENVIFSDDQRRIDLDDDSLTENTRGSYPLDTIDNIYADRVAPHPAHVIMLTADASGVMPPLARLNTALALYHFLSGYTSRLAGTETGVNDPEATFSACFGAPFMALQPTVYAEMLQERLEATGAQVWLVNTGWVGGPFGVGKRVRIQDTRSMVRAILNDRLSGVGYRSDPVFGFKIPLEVPQVDPALLTPRDQWDDPQAYDRANADLATLFRQNFEQFRPLVSEATAAGGP